MGIAKKAYSKISRRLPSALTKNIIKLLYYSGIRPKVNRKALFPLQKGVVVFSADIELSWGWRYEKNIREYLEKGQRERKNLPRILEMFEFYDIPVTWATLGHLFLHDCVRGENNLPHSDMPRPQYFTNKFWHFRHGDWYDHDPCSSVEHAPEWYAPDLIQKILQSKIKHEVACHSFSHADFSDENCSVDLADAEIKKCMQLAQNFGVKLESMVFPGNLAGNFKVLKENDFICYRKRTEFEIDTPFMDKNGLIAIPFSINLDRDPYGWSKDFHLYMTKKYVQSAKKNKLICHFWFHPSMDNWYLEHVLPKVLEYVSDQSKYKNIEVMTMKELAILAMKFY